MSETLSVSLFNGVPKRYTLCNSVCELSVLVVLVTFESCFKDFCWIHLHAQVNFHQSFG